MSLMKKFCLWVFVIPSLACLLAIIIIASVQKQNPVSRTVMHYTGLTPELFAPYGIAGSYPLLGHLGTKKLAWELRRRGGGDEDAYAKCGKDKQGKDKLPCTEYGHPEICCPETSLCLPTNNSLSGVYCCPAPPRASSSTTVLPTAPPELKMCHDTALSCQEDSYPCPAIANGGCCPWGFRCAVKSCVPGGGPSSSARPRPSSGQLWSWIPDLDGDGLTGTQDPVEQPFVTIVDGSLSSKIPWATGVMTTRAGENYVQYFASGSASAATFTATATDAGSAMQGKLLGEEGKNATSGAVGAAAVAGYLLLVSSMFTVGMVVVFLM
ncbi:hypothetical protein EDC01DRAFT_758289 [Geopyxis carbonaria]|nr:hypothetical protein EDC01DRAFT_758289 [Geopyxis carbonaria]